MVNTYVSSGSEKLGYWPRAHGWSAKVFVSCVSPCFHCTLIGKPWATGNFTAQLHKEHVQGGGEWLLATLITSRGALKLINVGFWPTWPFSLISPAWVQPFATHRVFDAIGLELLVAVPASPGLLQGLSQLLAGQELHSLKVSKWQLPPRPWYLLG